MAQNSSLLVSVLGRVAHGYMCTHIEITIHEFSDAGGPGAPTFPCFSVSFAHLF